MNAQKTVFEKGQPGLWGLSLHAVVAGAVLVAMVDALSPTQWAGVAMMAGGALAMLKSNSQWLRKPVNAGLLGEAIVYRDDQSPMPWRWLTGAGYSIGWCILAMAPGVPFGAFLASWLGFSLDLSIISAAFIFGGMVASAAIGAVVQNVVTYSRHVVIQFDAPIGFRRAAVSTVEGVGNSLPVSYASLVMDDRKGVVKTYILVSRSVDVETVKTEVCDAVTASGIRLTTPILVSSQAGQP